MISLTDRPNRLIERVAKCSSLDTIGRLRLTCRALATKALCGEYADSLRQRAVCWNAEDSVHSFGSLVGQSSSIIAAKLLQTVTVVGRCIHHHSLDSDEATAAQRQQALYELVATLHLTSRDDLRIALVVHDTRPESPYAPPKLCAKRTKIPPNDWRPTWKCAASTFAFGTELLAIIQNRVTSLDVFSSHGQECALPIDQLGPCLRHENLASSLHRLRAISMRLSHSISSENGESSSDDDDDDDESSTSSASVPSAPDNNTDNDSESLSDESKNGPYYVRDFLDLCPFLRSLHIHWYNLAARVNQTDAQMHQTRFFDHLEATKLPNLQNLSLAGIECRGDVLATFATTHSASLRRVNVDQIKLHSGEFQPFFTCLQAQMPHLEAYDLNNLYEGKRIICFLVPGEPYVQSLDSSDGPNCLKRAGQDVHNPIPYRQARGANMGCPELFQYILSSVRKYGPPMAAYWGSYSNTISSHMTVPTASHSGLVRNPTVP